MNTANYFKLGNAKLMNHLQTQKELKKKKKKKKKKNRLKVNTLDSETYSNYKAYKSDTCRLIKMIRIQKRKAYQFAIKINLFSDTVLFVYPFAVTVIFFYNIYGNNSCQKACFMLKLILQSHLSASTPIQASVYQFPIVSVVLG